MADSEFPKVNPPRKEEGGGDAAAVKQRREPTMPEHGDHGEESLQDQLKLKSGEMEEEKMNGVGRELVGDEAEQLRGECESIVHPENPDGDVEFVMIGSCIRWRGKVLNNGSELKLMLSTQWNNWPKPKTLLQECKSKRFADQV